MNLPIEDVKFESEFKNETIEDKQSFDEVIKINEENDKLTLQAGTIDESGLIKGLDRQGFTPDMNGSEIIGNCIDAKASYCIINASKETNKIRIIDDGVGMSLKKLYKMFDLYRSNHHDTPSIGAFGIGFKASSRQLSKDDGGKFTCVNVYTHRHDSDYLKAVCPWEKINEEGKYSNNIIINKMTHEEIEKFKLERKKNKLSEDQIYTGTTIEFVYSEHFNNLLQKQFTQIQETGNLKTFWGNIYGQFPIKIQLHDGKLSHTLHMYDPFGGSHEEYYLRKFTKNIYYLKDGRFVFDNPSKPGEYLEFGTTNQKTKTKENEAIVKHSDIEEAKIITFTSCWRKDPRHFNPEKPKILNTSEYIPNSYDEQFFNSEIETTNRDKFCAQLAVYRNGSQITRFVPAEVNYTNARAGGEERARFSYHRAKVEYTTNSTQDNELDTLLGVQQNKNQNQQNIPLSLSRAIIFLKKHHFTEIWNYMKKAVDDANHQKDIKKTTSTTVKISNSRRSGKATKSGKKLILTEDNDSCEEVCISNVKIQNQYLQTTLHESDQQISQQEFEDVKDKIENISEEGTISLHETQSYEHDHSRSSDNEQEEIHTVINTSDIEPKAKEVSPMITTTEIIDEKIENSMKYYTQAIQLIAAYTTRDGFNCLHGEELLKIVENHLKKYES